MQEKTSSSAPQGLFPPLSVTAISLILLISAAIFAAALFSYNPSDPAWRHNSDGTPTNTLGTIGAWYSDLSFSLIGKLSYLLPIALLAMCVNAWLEKRFDKELLSWRLIMLFSAILSGCVLWAKHDPVAINTVAQTGGGALGAWLAIGLEKSIKSVPVIMAFSAVIFAISISLLLNLPWFKFADWIGKGIVALFAGLFGGHRKNKVNHALAGNDNSAENTALQDKIKHLNEVAEQRQYEKILDEASAKAAPPRPSFTIDRYQPEEQANPPEPATPRFSAVNQQHAAPEPQVQQPQPSEPARHAEPIIRSEPIENNTQRERMSLEPAFHEPQQTDSAVSSPTKPAENTARAEPSFFDFGSISPEKSPAPKPQQMTNQPTQEPTANPRFSDMATTTVTTGLATAHSFADQSDENASRTTNDSPAQIPDPQHTSKTGAPDENRSLADTFASGGTQSLLAERTTETGTTNTEAEAVVTAINTESTTVQTLDSPNNEQSKPETPIPTTIPEAKPRPIDLGNLRKPARETTTVALAEEASPVAATPIAEAPAPKPMPEPVQPVAEPEPAQQAPESTVPPNQPAPTASISTATTTATIGKAYESDTSNTVDDDSNRPYELPSIQLLDNPPPQENAYTEDVLAEMAGVLEGTLNQFNIKAIVMHVSPGPVITRFELELAPGIQAKKITNLSQDLARALAVSRVRVEEVIPGSSYVGLEVPNKQRQIVYFKDVVRSNVFQDSTSPLTISLGSDTSGKPVVADLMKMPHALVAGTTGSGKSVCINVMLLSMLYKASPKDLRLILVDPKMLEMSMYEDIPHLLTPVITDMNEAENALTWAVGEMEHRYQLMAALKVRKIDAFNEMVDAANAEGEPIKDPLWQPDESVGYTHHPSLERLPFIVIVIDELADMMMVVGKQVEQLIARLTQKARAAGIHVVLATQRPSTDVLTGLIKANVPTRIAFQVSSGTDSRVIIDGVGAEKLLGHGDMLYVPPGASHPQRLHGAFVGDAETDRITDYLRTTGEADYIDGVTGKQDPETLGAFGAAEAAETKEDADPLYEEAVEIVLQTGKASISSVQRQLRIGYNRAARMIEDMQEQGIVSEPVNGIRKVLGAPRPRVEE